MGKTELKIEIDTELLAQARAAGVSPERIAERAVREALLRADPDRAQERARQWAEENAEAIADYNRRIRERGTVGAEFRMW